jgi:hypothetical protein
MKRTTIAILITVLVSACGSFLSDLNSTPASTSIPEDKEETRADEKLGQAVIVFEKSGGFAGVTEKWTVYRDGRVVSVEGREHQVAVEEISTLLMEIENMGFFEIDGPDQWLSDCRDCFTYQITVSIDGRTKVVNAVDGQVDPADTIWGIINLIEVLLLD